MKYSDPESEQKRGYREFHEIIIFCFFPFENNNPGYFQHLTLLSKLVFLLKPHEKPGLSNASLFNVLLIQTAVQKLCSFLQLVLEELQKTHQSDADPKLLLQLRMWVQLSLWLIPGLNCSRQWPHHLKVPMHLLQEALRYTVCGFVPNPQIRWRED